MYASKNRATNDVRQKLIEWKREMGDSTIVVEDFDIPLSEMDRTSRQKLSKNVIKSQQHHQLTGCYLTSIEYFIQQ